MLILKYILLTKVKYAQLSLEYIIKGKLNKNKVVNYFYIYYQTF